MRIHERKGSIMKSFRRGGSSKEDMFVLPPIKRITAYQKEYYEKKLFNLKND